MKSNEEVLVIEMRSEFINSGCFQCQQCGKCCEMSKDIDYLPEYGDKFKIKKYPCEHYNKNMHKCNRYDDRPYACKAYPMFPLKYPVNTPGCVVIELHGICPESRRIAKAITSTELRKSV